MSWFGTASYAIVAVVYAVTAFVLLLGRTRALRPWAFIGAAAGTAAWGAAISLLLYLGSAVGAGLLGLDALHGLIWVGAALSLLAPARPATHSAANRTLLALASILTVWVILAGTPLVGLEVQGSVILGLIGIALIGLLVVEQIYRNANRLHESAVRPVCLWLGGIFLTDLVVYSQATLSAELAPVLWESRGIVNAALAPLAIWAVKRRPEQESGFYVSRQVAFYTASLMGVGGYLLVIGAIAYLIPELAGDWALSLQWAFLLCALALLLFLMFATSIKARLRVLLIKHFYRSKYDYRHEWLRLTEKLARTSDSRQLAGHAFEGLAGIVGSKGGALWITFDSQHFDRVIIVGDHRLFDKSLAPEHPVVAFLETQRWVIDSEEYRREPERYGGAFGAPENELLPSESVIIPLDCQGVLLGLAVVEKPPEAEALNFEDHDILKTAGKQIAVVLAQALAQEKLAETRQFEAINKLTTFLMHDLKNVIAQQELVLANAKRFRDRPEFIDDLLSTVHSGVERTKRVLSQLKGAEEEPGQAHRRVDITKLAMEVRSQCADREPVPGIEFSSSPVFVNMDRDKLLGMLIHLVRNAQEATPPDGRIDMTFVVDEGVLVISITDTGCGMDAEFVRDRLFRPFDSTKGTKGMGIGAYQVRDTVRAMGGDIDVHSEPDAGTSFRLSLPGVVEQTSQSTHEEAAP